MYSCKCYFFSVHCCDFIVLYVLFLLQIDLHQFFKNPGQSEVLDGLKQCARCVRLGFGSSERGDQSMVSIPSSSRKRLHTHRMRPGIVVHQEEPRTRYFSTGCDSGSKDCIPLPSSSQGAVG